MFGKKISEYVAFQRPVLVALMVVGLARLALSLAGVPQQVVVWCSMNLVVWASVFRNGIEVHRRGFGSYRQLLPLAILQMALFHGIAVLGIVLHVAGFPNIYAAPEFSGGVEQNQWLHAGAHLTIGMVAASLVLWGASSLVLLVTRRVARRPATVPAG